MNQRKKRNIIIGALCGVLLLMVVGYAAFSSVLNITGTSHIASNWDIKITGITEKNIVGGATTATNEDGTKKITGIGTLNATFETNLVSPGDSIEYDITIKNGGSLNAKLDKITLSEPNNDMITFTASGLTEGDPLDAGSSKVLTVEVEYKDIPEGQGQPSSTLGTLTVKLDFSQSDEGTVNPGEETAADKLIATAVTSGDGLYADDYESGRYIYKGGNPNNYITFNNETWRILSVESDNTIKIIKEDSIGNRAFDTKGLRTTGYCSNGSALTYGCNAWSVNDNFVNGTKTGKVSKDAELNTYLNTTYYNSLSETAKNQIYEGIYNVGGTLANGSNIGDTIMSEKGITASGKIALLTVSEYVRASNNNECTSLNSYYSVSNCYSSSQTHNWLFNIAQTTANKYMWTLTPLNSSPCGIFYVGNGGNVEHQCENYGSGLGTVPVLYLKSGLILKGMGTSDSPYTLLVN